METIRIGDDRLKIMLSREDMSYFAIDGRDLNCENEMTRQALLRVLSEAGREASFETPPGRLHVQVYESEMGCELFVTRLPSDAVEETAQKTVYRSFSGLDELLTLCRRLAAIGIGADSVLFGSEDRFWLGLCSDFPRFVYDYGEETEEESQAYILEYATPILLDEAAPRLAALFP